MLRAPASRTVLHGPARWGNHWSGRRGFPGNRYWIRGWLIGGTVPGVKARIGVIGAAVAIAAVISLLVLREAGPDGPRVVVGRLDEFPSGSVTAMDLDVLLADPVPRVSEMADGNRAQVSIFIVSDSDKGILALYAHDPHLGCRVALASELPSDIGRALPGEVVFLNPCHGEKYDLRGGYLGGPSPRGLDRFAVSIVEGEVVVDVSAFQYGPPRADLS